MNNVFSRADNSVISQWWWTIDRTLLTAIISLIIFGVVLIAAASPPVAERIGLYHYHFLYRHLIFMVPALFLFFATSMLSPRNVWRAASVLFIGSICAMALVLLTGAEIKGAQRWINVFGFSLQPSEFVKPAFAITAAWFMSRQKEDANFPGYKITAALFCLVVGLLLLQPDMGMTAVVTVTLGTQAVLAGLPWILILVLVVAAAGGGVLAYSTFDHVKSRVDRFLDPASGDTYQVEKSLEAIENGGLFGVGPGQGIVKLDIPDAHADFIYAVAAEELGFFLISVLIFLFAFILLRGLHRVMDSKDMFVILAVGGILTMFGLQSIIHMGSNLSLLPTKGMTLPFISYGGSSLIAVAFSMGAVMALTRRQINAPIARQGYQRYKQK